MKRNVLIVISLALFLMTSCNTTETTLSDTTNGNTDQESDQEKVTDSETIEVDTKKDAEEEIDYTSPDSITVLVNKEYALPDGYEPKDLVVPNVRFPFTEDDPKKQLRKEAAEALEQLFDAAEEEGHFLFAQSGYRSFERQEAIFASNVEQDGEEVANQYSARPGESEHQTGLVMDITSEAVEFRLVEEFGDTPEGKWVAENAYKYGFIVRYEKGKEDITGYQYEPWHLRYVGKKAAKTIYEQDLTLEEYVGVHN